MAFPKKLWWKIYFFLLAPFLVVGLLNLFNPQSPQYVYYNALIAFHENYTLAYFLADTVLVRMKSGDSTGVADVQYHGKVSGYLAEKASASSADTSKAGNPCRGKQ